MGKWNTYKLGDVCRYCTNRIKISNNYISTENMLPDKGGVCESTNVPNGNAVEYKIGDVLISNIRPYFKKIWHADCNGSCSPDILCIRSESMINDTYLYYLLSQQIFFDYVMLGAKGCKMPRGDKDHIMKWNLTLPPLKIQEQIAEILSSLDDKIDLLQRENETLEALAETLFRECFIEKMNDTWKDCLLGDVANIFAGGDKPKVYSPIKTNQCYIPIYSNGIDKDGLYGYTDKARIIEESVTISARGTIGFIVHRIEPYVPIVRLISLIPKDNMHARYLYFYLKTLNIMGSGTTQQQLTVPEIKEYHIPLPPYYLIQDFINKTDDLFSKKNTNKNQIQTLINTRDTLLPKLMSGEIQID